MLCLASCDFQPFSKTVRAFFSKYLYFLNFSINSKVVHKFENDYNYSMRLEAI